MTTQPTDKKNRLEECTRLIESAKKCLKNGDKDCVMRMIEELVRANCHDGNAVSREIADKVKGVVHELWLRSNDEEWCELLTILRDLGISRSWVRDALGMSTKGLSRWLAKCGIDWEGRATRNEIVKQLEDFLRERFGWDEIRMCEELFRFIGVDVEAFRRHGIEPCVWLNDLEKLSNLKRPYWFGLRVSDLMVREFDDIIRLEIDTTSSVAVFFSTLLNTVKTPSLRIWRKRKTPTAKYVQRPIELTFYVDLGVNKWPWPIELSANELERIIDGFGDEELAEFIAGLIDGDGAVWYASDSAYVGITACKACPKRTNLDVLREVIAERFGITGSIHQLETDDALEFGGGKAVKLLRRVAKYMHHPLRRLRAELILALYDGRISLEVFEKLYEQTKYERGRDDIKRNRGLETLARAAPQTHTHGGLKILPTKPEKHRIKFIMRPPRFKFKSHDYMSQKRFRLTISSLRCFTELVSM